jgi:hypothetical protein
MARLSPAQQAQLDQLQAQAAEPEEGPKFSAREILHELASVAGRHNLHDSIDALPDSYDNLTPDEPEDADEQDDGDDGTAREKTSGTFEVDPNPAPKGL